MAKYPVFSKVSLSKLFEIVRLLRAKPFYCTSTYIMTVFNAVGVVCEVKLFSTVNDRTHGDVYKWLVLSKQLS